VYELKAYLRVKFSVFGQVKENFNVPVAVVTVVVDVDAANVVVANDLVAKN
jgi:hypothetical protein